MWETANPKLSDRPWALKTRLRPEPHRLYRRPFGLSYAAMAGASSLA